jgi:hypothetical protein
VEHRIALEPLLFCSRYYASVFGAFNVICDAPSHRPVKNAASWIQLPRPAVSEKYSQCPDIQGAETGFGLLPIAHILHCQDVRIGIRRSWSDTFSIEWSSGTKRTRTLRTKSLKAIQTRSEKFLTATGRCSWKDERSVLGTFVLGNTCSLNSPLGHPFPLLLIS